MQNGVEENILSSVWIKAEAERLGFSACGFAKAQPVDEGHRQFFHDWVQRGLHADMTYLERNMDKRSNPACLVEDCRTIISVALNYFPKTFIPAHQPQISWYAYGRDYHEVMKEKLQALLGTIQKQYSDANVTGRCFCDTAPIFERYWAWQCGLGWIGRNKQLIIPHAGSTYFLGEIFLNQQVDQYGIPMNDHCGNCMRCIEHCPTDALTLHKGLDARKCVSYLTIENRGEIPVEAASKMHPYVYGCDRCQQVCPYLKFAVPTHEKDFSPTSELLSMDWSSWKELTQESYQRVFKGSAVKRAKYPGLQRNVHALSIAEKRDDDTFNMDES